MTERHDLRSRTHHRPHCIQVDSLLVRERAHKEARAAMLRELLPRDEIRMMVQRSHHDLVTFRHIRLAPCRRHEVQRLGGATREYQAFGIGDTNKLCDALPSGVVAVRRATRERVRAAMRIGVVVLVVVAHRVEHHTRFLRCGGRVEVMQFRAGGEQGKIGATRIDHVTVAAGALCWALTSTRPAAVRTSYTGNGCSAGCRRTTPVRQSNRAPCQRHSSVPSPCSTPSEIRNSACVQ